mgnify:CR=1 FL=1
MRFLLRQWLTRNRLAIRVILNVYTIGEGFCCCCRIPLFFASQTAGNNDNKDDKDDSPDNTTNKLADIIRFHWGHLVAVLTRYYWGCDCSHKSARRRVSISIISTIAITSTITKRRCSPTIIGICAAIIGRRWSCVWGGSIVIHGWGSWTGIRRCGL